MAEKTVAEYKPYSLLIKETLRILERNQQEFVRHELGDEDVCGQFAYGTTFDPRSSIVLAEDTARELGAPNKTSLNATMWTKERELLSGTLWIAGTDFSTGWEQSLSFLQLAMLQLPEDSVIDDFRLSRIMNLTNKIPGYMTKSLNNRIWARIHVELANKGFNLYALGQCMNKAFQSSCDRLGKMDIVLIAGREDLLQPFAPIIQATKALSGENKKLRWIEEGILSCNDVNCTTCDEKLACDTIRSIIASGKSDEERRETCLQPK